MWEAGPGVKPNLPPPALLLWLPSTPPRLPRPPPQTPLSYSLVCRQRCGSSQTSPSFSSFGGSWKKERVCNLITNVRKKMFLELLVFTPRYISIRTVWFYVLLKRSTTVVHDAGGFIYLHCSLLFSSRRLNVVRVLNRIKCIHIENTAVVYLLRIKPAITVYGSARARIVSKKTWTFWRKGFASLRLFLSFLVKINTSTNDEQVNEKCDAASNQLLDCVATVIVFIVWFIVSNESLTVAKIVLWYHYVAHPVTGVKSQKDWPKKKN